MLTVLCIFSMGGGVLGVLIGILSIIDIELIKVFARIPGYASIFSLTNEAHFLYPYVKIILYGVSFTGALYILKLKKTGFYLYSTAQILLLVIPYLMWSSIPVYTFFADLPDMIFTFAFIGAYTLYLPYMNPVPDQDTNGTEK